MVISRRHKVIALIYVFAAVMAVVLPRVVAKFEASKHLKINVNVSEAPKCTSIVLLGRRAERSSEFDVGIPFRNSILAIYKRSGNTWSMTGRQYFCRSETTALQKPEISDAETLQRYVESSGRKYRYGYQSVPIGFFHLARTLMHTGSGLLVSEWGRADSKLNLKQPQVLYEADVITSGAVSVGLSSSGIVVNSSHFKKDCFIHGTETVEWSHRDTLGCITLYDPNEFTSQASDIKTLMGQLQVDGAFNNDSELGLIVVPFVELTGADDDLLPKSFFFDVIEWSKSRDPDIAKYLRKVGT